MGIDQNIDLTTEQRAAVLALLERHLPGTTAWVYGSRAKWTARPHSDLDLAVFATPEQHNQVGALREAFEESNLPFRVDLFVWDAVPEPFRKQIEAEHTVLMGSKRDGVRSEWHEVPVSKVAVAVIGGTPVRSAVEYWGGDIPWATAKDVAAVSSRYLDQVQECITEQGLESSAAKLMPAGTVVITARGTVGALAQLRREMTFNQTCYAILPKDGLDNDFLYWALKGTLSEMRSLTYGTVFETITRRTFDSWRIPVPPLPEQRAIAHILGTLDDKIELNRRTNETLEGMARALFQSWFVDFDLVRAKAALRRHAPDPITPPLRGSRGDSVDHARAYLDAMDPAIAALFPDRFVDSALGAIPAGWEVKTLGEVVEVVGGTTPSTKVAEYWDGGKHNWATPRDLSSLSTPVLLDTERKITDAGLDKVGSGLLPPGTLLLSSRAPIGYLAISEKPVAVNQGFIAMPPGDMASSQFLLYWCSTFHDEIINHANGSTFLEISKGNFRRIPLVLPDKEVMTTFDNYARQFHQRIVSDERESRALAALRDALLPRLVSGALRVGHPTSQAN